MGTGGVERLIEEISRLAAQYPLSADGTRSFLLAFSERYAYIRLQDARNPFRFLRQMEGNPPVQLGADGFKRSLVDDTNPARHYAAFVFIGYWLPSLWGLIALWLWEAAGFVRYFYWSQPDIRSGYVGLFHGRLIRRYGHTILPALMARDLTETNAWSRLSKSGKKAKQKERLEQFKQKYRRGA